jgi:hypothetical protein
MRASPKDKCFCCKKKVNKLKEPFEGNYDKGVDVAFRPHYGSRWASKNTSENLILIAVICDDCYADVVAFYEQKHALRVKKPFL